MYERFFGTLEAFNIAMNANGLTDWVTSYRADLKKFATMSPQGLSLRLVFIDGDHSYPAVAKDIGVVERYLLPGGWICFDDAFSSYDGVNEALQKHVIDSGHYQCCQQMLYCAAALIH